jgi:transcriptional regulator with XRE-family HTH domain
MERFRKADGAALRRRREDAWLTQQELAELAQVHRTTINTIENGKDTSPRMSTLLALARALKVHPDALVEGSPGGSPRGSPSGSSRPEEESHNGYGEKTDYPFEIKNLDHYRDVGGAAWDIGSSGDLGDSQGEKATFRNR